MRSDRSVTLFAGFERVILSLLFCFVCLFFAVDDMTFQHEEDTEYEIAGHQNNFKLKSALCLQETMTLGQAVHLQ